MYTVLESDRHDESSCRESAGVFGRDEESEEVVSVTQQPQTRGGRPLGVQVANPTRQYDEPVETFSFRHEPHHHRTGYWIGQGLDCTNHHNNNQIGRAHV